MEPLTLLGLFAIVIFFLYVVIQILGLFDITISSMSIYLMFLLFLLLSIVVLPNGVPEI